MATVPETGTSDRWLDASVRQWRRIVRDLDDTRLADYVAWQTIRPRGLATEDDPVGVLQPPDPDDAARLRAAHARVTGNGGQP